MFAKIHQMMERLAHKDDLHVLAFRDVPADSGMTEDVATASGLAAIRVRHASDAGVQALCNTVEALQADIERLEALLAADLHLLRAGPTELGFTLETAGRAVAIIAGQLATWLREHGAENYTETGMEFAHHETPYTVTVQRRNGMTPHQLRREAERSLAQVEADAGRLRAFVQAKADAGDAAAAALLADLNRIQGARS